MLPNTTKLAGKCKACGAEVGALDVALPMSLETLLDVREKLEAAGREHACPKPLNHAASCPVHDGGPCDCPKDGAP
jgi:hypothetical protein